MGGVILLVLMVALTLAAATLPASARAIPISMIVVAVIAAVVLLSKPDTGGEADFGPGAGLMFGAAVTIVVTAIADLAISLMPSRSPEGSVADPS